MAEAPWAPLDFILVLNQDAYFWQNFHNKLAYRQGVEDCIAKYKAQATQMQTWAQKPQPASAISMELQLAISSAVHTSFMEHAHVVQDWCMVGGEYALHPLIATYEAQAALDIITTMTTVVPQMLSSADVWAPDVAALLTAEVAAMTAWFGRATTVLQNATVPQSGPVDQPWWWTPEAGV